MSYTNHELRQAITKLQETIQTGSLLYDMFLQRIITILLSPAPNNIELKLTTHKSTENNSHNSHKSNSSYRESIQSEKMTDMTHMKPYDTESRDNILDIQELERELDSKEEKEQNMTSFEIHIHDRMDFIETCKDNLEVLVFSFENMDKYCKTYPFKEQVLYVDHL